MNSSSKDSQRNFGELQDEIQRMTLAYTTKKVETCYEASREDAGYFVSCITKWKKFVKKDSMDLELKCLFELEKLSRCLDSSNEQNKQDECKKSAGDKIVTYLMDFQTNLEKNSSN